MTDVNHAQRWQHLAIQVKAALRYAAFQLSDKDAAATRRTLHDFSDFVASSAPSGPGAEEAAYEALAQSNRRLREGLEKAKHALLAWMVIAEADQAAIEEALAPIEAALKDNGHG